MSVVKKLTTIHKNIEACRACPDMCGTPVHGPAVETEIMLVGQAPGPHEATYGKPFAFTSGKTLFKWFSGIGISEEEFRSHVYIAATARCFPGKAGRGDREPTREEMDKCSLHLKKEVEVLRPKLIIAVGRVAITEVLGPKNFPKSKKLADVVGIKIKADFHGHAVDVVCLPHPSGVSSWPYSKEGAQKLGSALELIKNHPVLSDIKRS